MNSALPVHLGGVVIEKGAFVSLLTSVGQLTYLLIYIYIYIYIKMLRESPQGVNDKV